MKQIIYAISDSSGETATIFSRSMIAQFPMLEVEQKRFSFINSAQTLQEIFTQAKKDHAIIFYTLNNPEYDQIVKKLTQEHQVLAFDILNPYLKRIEAFTHQQASHEIGAARKLSAQYFDRIKAIDFAAENDDGKNPKSMLEADVVLLGISRTSKTPLSFFLANKQIKVMNLPLVPSVQLPKELWQVDPKKIVGLTTNEDVLQQIRQQRMIAYGLKPTTNYSDTSKIQAELKYADDLYQKLGCLVINVANRSIEETAAIIENRLNLNSI
ncbi:MAG: kinase/pyrophosphorylase [Lactobacillus sp.]|uniref:Putative pyruvate, phosphate dikinase regulatory protein n=1 Tax=Bombilactobacillus bombi TaxID=1303590 RepID=A0A347SQX1_9LACO|nr:pyruvate, water dikinase regulatory protein [Bombilactobacillus bombi]MCO6542180.1 kinase/pyrophosphorylase [Lactobacillus sp.]AXX64430.1 kinase/pyrophosphorylase [Bombilactobacillus bombi]MCO6543892.1 kinase/pyrophosphorylase [Lactobacillus sp.]RHW46036.1 phosphoenolpyruvate synthase regulatory protein [Bombilactobacillus bombi]RHW49778.1 phosphoenolpyruvate synthase regulatory protein [Bombilactobacillus bombi]